MTKATVDLLKAMNGLNMGNYDVSIGVLIDIKQMCKDPYDLMTTMLKIGFIKGQRAEKARKRGTVK